jgi:dTDP-4-dehydrorhamnose reductase
MRVAVVGARGQLGAGIVHELCRYGHEVFAFDRATLDITRPASVEEHLVRVGPEAIINCAAYNAVDAAEDDPVAALRVNAFAVRTLARAAQTLGATLVHYGSDFVFDGTASSPYTEEDQPNPRSVYGTSKMLGEWFARDAPRAFVLRVESLFGSAPGGAPAKGSVEVLLAAIKEGRSQKVFEDRVVSPTFVPDAARATRELLELAPPAGLYHCVNAGHVTWLEFAREAARLLGRQGEFEPVRLADLKLRADRPVYCALSNVKLAAAGIQMPSWQDALARYIGR